MASAFQVLCSNSPADEALYNALITLEVEENCDLSGAMQLTLAVSRDSKGEPTFVNDTRLGPQSKLAVVATGADNKSQCIFEGVTLSHRLHLEGAATTGSTLVVQAQDLSWQMNREEKTREWTNATEGGIANKIFGEYGFQPDSANTQDDSPSYTDQGYSLMQRATDAQFLRMLARRNGKLFRVVGGEKAGQTQGVFARPKLDGTPQAKLSLGDPKAWTVPALDLFWDVARPAKVAAYQALATQKDEAKAETTDSGLPLLDARSLVDFTQEPASALLTTFADSASELTYRAESLLREAAWFARCEGEADATRLGTILRAGKLVLVEGAGSLNSGKYLVWSVRHTLTRDAHRMRFVLVRNAVGGTSAGGAGGLLGALGGLL